MVVFFNDTATTEIYTLSLHDALPIYCGRRPRIPVVLYGLVDITFSHHKLEVRLKISNVDRKSTRLNSSHANISYAVFCLKKKKERRGVQVHTPGDAFGERSEDHTSEL